MLLFGISVGYSSPNTLTDVKQINSMQIISQSRICLSRMRQLTPKLLVANIPDGKIDDVKKYMVQ